MEIILQRIEKVTLREATESGPEHSIKIAVVTLTGDVMPDDQDFEAFKSVIQDCIDQDAGQIVLDMTEAPLINSSGVGMIIAGVKIVKNEVGGDIKLVYREKVKDKVILIDPPTPSLFKRYETVEDAIQSYSEPPSSSTPDGRGCVVSLLIPVLIVIAVIWYFS